MAKDALQESFDLGRANPSEKKWLFQGPTVKAVELPKDINRGDSIDTSMPTKPTTKSEPVKPFHEEEKDNDKPTTPLNEEPDMNKEPPTEGRAPESSRTPENEDVEYELAVKALNARFEGIETAQKSMLEVLNKLLEKANYSSKPASRDADYPTPPDDGPTSDGLQAPKVTQMVNPHSKPFGKGQKQALNGAGDGAKETGMQGNERNEVLKDVLAGKTTIAKAHRAGRVF